ncbi:MAG: hypothetical protein ABFD54_04455 [Armatimonadota bacterium]
MAQTWSEALRSLCIRLTGSNPSADFASVVSRAAGRMIQAFDESNTVICGPGCKYESVQAAVDVQAAKYKVTGIRQMVAVAPGVERDYVPADGVDVVYDGPDTGRAGGRTPVNECDVSSQYFDLPYPGGLIAIRADDGFASWPTPHADFGGVSAAAYARDHGVTISHAIVPSLLSATPGTYMSYTQVKSLFCEYGCEILNHTKSHLTITNPLSIDDAMDEIIGGRDALENMSLTGVSFPDDWVGIRVNGFVQPGDWSSTAAMTYYEDLSKQSAQIVRSSHAYSMAYAYGTPSYESVQRHGMGYLGASGLPSSYAGVLQWVKHIAASKARIAVLFHSPIESADTRARFKNLIDAIVALRDDRTTYPTICVHPVSCNALVFGRSAPAMYDSTGKLIIPHGMEPPIDAWDADTDIASAGSLQGFWISGGASNTIYVRQDVDGVKYFEVTRGGTDGPGVQWRPGLTPGGQYVLSFDFKHGTTGTNPLYIRALRGESYINLHTSSTYAMLTQADGTTWTRHYAMFSLPMWSGNQVQLFWLKAGDLGTYSIKNVRLDRVG